MDMVALNRDYCAFGHVTSMDTYFEEAESPAALNIFWDENTVFNKMFRKLDLQNVIELACGRGRHVQMYEEKASHIVLVDILQKNIEYCKERFTDNKKIEYYCNNGYNLEELDNDTYTALFCYDAMVHFEMMDIYEYLKDIHRVLRAGGMALLHHSNNTADYKASFKNASEDYHGRNYMSKDLFAYLAYRAGFDIVCQELQNWGIKDLDCVTLLKK